VALGWSRSQVVVIDDDMGVSAAAADVSADIPDTVTVPAAAFSSRCIPSGVAPPAAFAIVHPFLLASGASEAPHMRPRPSIWACPA
jgi:hypothetical protein